MKLQEITLTNFRCFERCTVPLSPKLTVLVGNNGAGKSAILDGIAYALSRVLSRLPKVTGKNLRLEDIRFDARGVQMPYLRIESTSVDGIHWGRHLKRDATKQTAADVPDGPGDKALYTILDPVIHAINEGQKPILPVFAHYGTNRAVFDIPKRRGYSESNSTRFEALNGALESSSRFKETFEWFYSQQAEAQADIIDFGNEFVSFMDGPNPGDAASHPYNSKPELRRRILQKLLAVDSEESAFSVERELELAVEQFSSLRDWPEFFTTIRFTLGDGAERFLQTINFNG